MKCHCPHDRDVPSLPCATHFRNGTSLTVAHLVPAFYVNGRPSVEKVYRELRWELRQSQTAGSRYWVPA